MTAIFATKEGWGRGGSVSSVATNWRVRRGDGRALADSKGYVRKPAIVAPRLSGALGVGRKKVEHVPSPKVIFEQMAAIVNDETLFVSSSTQRAMHPAYQRIIGLGPVVLPLLIDDMRRNHSDWFWALQAITGHDPIPEEKRGNILEMIECWVAWAKSNGQ